MKGPFKASEKATRQASLVLSYEGISKACVGYLVTAHGQADLAYHVITGTAVT